MREGERERAGYYIFTYTENVLCVKFISWKRGEGISYRESVCERERGGYYIYSYMVCVLCERIISRKWGGGGV